jgi:LDH2 family malate/lactate/ureidoglycolate dehydrogenase
MVVISAPDLRQRVYEIFGALDSPQPVSQRVAHSLVESNLVGHDSHGVIRVPAYARAIRAGTLNPKGEICVVRESASTALLDCGYTFGQVAAAQGMELAVAKARQCDIAMVVLQHCGHTGRLGEYPVMAAERGFMGMVFCHGAPPGGLVAPFGGIGRALGANPIAWGVPGGDGKPVFLDYATSVVAQGKIQVAADKGEEIPEGWLLDVEGRPTRDPHDQFSGGVMLPFGGHKGYALGVLIELLGGGLSGVGVPLQPGYRWDQGTVLVAVNIEAFQPLDAFRELVADFGRRLKATPRAAGCAEILLPGEPEWRCKAERERTGIPLPEKTWERIRETAASLGLARG